MANKDSTMLGTSRYVHGGTTEKSAGYLEWWEKKSLSISDSDDTYVVEKFFEGRLDLISYTFYDDPKLWWVIAQYNSILDPFTEVVEGVYLRIPKLERVRTEFMTGKTGGISSKRVQNANVEPFLSTNS